MKFDDLTSLRVVKEVYDLKSLTLAAKRMNLSKPAVSKRLENLEQASYQDKVDDALKDIASLEFDSIVASLTSN